MTTLAFKTSGDFSSWLAKHHASSDGIFLRIFKKGTKIKSVTYDEAVDEALCYGWIDGQKKPCDEKSWLQKFTPRRAKSVWSKKNKERIARLIKLNKMRPAGLKQVAAAKADGRWQTAYDSSKAMKVPMDFLQELSKDKKAEAFFKTLNRANTYAIAWRLQTAKKPETRDKRKKAILAMMAKGQKLH
jgi:uncharacterized protein YdeI (YjbR/CyaY-like superfamily)